MATFQITSPDGGVYEITAPDNASQDQLLAFAQEHHTAPSATQNIDITSGYHPKLNIAGYNTGIEIPDSVDNFLAGAGKAFSDVRGGLGQLTTALSNTRDYKGAPTPQDVAETRRLDAPLMRTGAGIAGNLVGNTAVTLPTMAIPGANTFTGAALIGAGIGAAQPTTSPSETAINTGLGAISSTAGQALGTLLGKAAQPFKSNMTPEESRLAQVATNNGIPLSAGELLNSKYLKIANSVMENMPLTAGTESARRTTQQQAFNQAALSRAGVTGNVATPDVLAAAKQNIGGQLGNIAENNVLDFNQGLTSKLADIVDDASKHLPPTKASQISDQVDQLLSQVDQNGVMSGTNYQGWREPLRALAKKGDEFSRYFGQIKSALDSSFRDQLQGNAGQQFRDLSGQYANLKTIINSMGGNSPSTLAGNITPAQLGMSLSQSIGKEGKALGRGDLNDLVRAGNLFVRPQIPDSGTAQRAMIQSLLTGGAGGLGGAGIAGATGHDPIEGAIYGAGATTAGLLAPKLAQTLLSSPNLQKYIVNQATNPNARLLAEILKNSGRTLGMAAIPAMAQ